MAAELLKSISLEESMPRALRIINDVIQIDRVLVLSALFQGDVVIANWTSSEPTMREFLNHYGIRSLLAVPITINEKT